MLVLLSPSSSDYCWSETHQPHTTFRDEKPTAFRALCLEPPTMIGSRPRTYTEAQNCTLQFQVLLYVAPCSLAVKILLKILSQYYDHTTKTFFLFMTNTWASWIKNFRQLCWILKNAASHEGYGFNCGVGGKVTSSRGTEERVADMPVLRWVKGTDTQTLMTFFSERQKARFPFVLNALWFSNGPWWIQPHKYSQQGAACHLRSAVADWYDWW